MMDPEATFNLVNDKFEDQHERFIESINGHNEEQYKYLDAMLKANHKEIQSTIQEYLMLGANKDKATTFMRLQNLHLRLLCQNYPSKVLERVRRVMKNEIHFALDDCLEICQEYNQVEACAILANKMTNYLSSLTQYIALLTNKTHFDYPTLIW